MKIDIVIIDQDRKYTDKIKKYWKQRDRRINIKTYPDIGSYKNIKEGRGVDLIIINESYIGEELSDEILSANPLIQIKKLLSAGPKTEILPWTEDPDSETYLYKYLTMPDFYRAILFKLSISKEVGPKPAREEKGNFIIITALAAGPGLSSLGKFIAGYLSKKESAKENFYGPNDSLKLRGGEVFYINLDPMASIREEGGKYNLTDLISSMRIAHGDPGMRLKACLYEKNGVSYIRPVENPRDFFQISLEEWEEFFSLLRSEYERMVVDIPYTCIANFYKLFKHADKLLVLSEDPNSKEAWRRLKLYDKEIDTLFVSCSSEGEKGADIYLDSNFFEENHLGAYPYKMTGNRDLEELIEWLN